MSSIERNLDFVFALLNFGSVLREQVNRKCDFAAKTLSGRRNNSGRASNQARNCHQQKRESSQTAEFDHASQSALCFGRKGKGYRHALSQPSNAWLYCSVLPRRRPSGASPALIP